MVMVFNDFMHKYSDRYDDEEKCRSILRQIREQEGIVCAKCGGTDHTWKKSKSVWECQVCGYQTGLRNGTIMEESHLPVRYWLALMHFLTINKTGGGSTKDIQIQLDHMHYEPILKMVHKLRLSMDHQFSEYEITDHVQLDKGFFKKPRKNVF
jgi:ribosomal protein L37AE/L43A